MRETWLRIHRYVGLFLAAFLVIIGLTGSVIAFFNDLDNWVNPDLLRVEPQGAALSPLELRDRMAAIDPHAHVYYLHFPERADQSFSAYVEGAIDPDTGEPFDIDYDEVFANPYTGERIGERMWGNFSFNREDLITQLYFLHYSLVLPEKLGEGFMGWIALLWVFDCFVGLYLTFPRTNGTGKRKNFWRNWFAAWRIKGSAGSNRLIYDVHRALSLWVWLVLLMFALSGFALNLPGVYASAIHKFADYEDIEERAELAQPLVDPAINWEQALALGERYMAEQAQTEGFTIERPAALIYRRETGTYFYRVQSSRDVVNYGATSVGIDGMSGALVGVEIPTGHRAGNTFTSWIMALHMAMVFGWPWKAFVTSMGIIVVTLSMTGVLIWWRKRRAVARVRQPQRVATE